MSKSKILITGRHPEILKTVVRLVNSNPDWWGVGALTDDEAFDLSREHRFDVVLLGGGVDEDSEKALQRLLSADDQVVFVKHYGGGSGLLSAEIYEALKIRSSKGA